jgi:hypothetical protein
MPPRRIFDFRLRSADCKLCRACPSPSLTACELTNREQPGDATGDSCAPACSQADTETVHQRRPGGFLIGAQREFVELVLCDLTRPAGTPAGPHRQDGCAAKTKCRMSIWQSSSGIVDVQQQRLNCALPSSRSLSSDALSRFEAFIGMSDKSSNLEIRNPPELAVDLAPPARSENSNLRFQIRAKRAYSLERR